MYTCLICSSDFKNSRSLHSHKYKYHPKATTSTDNSDRELKMEYRMDDNGYNNENEFNHKSIGQADESSENEIDINDDKSLSPYIERLPKLFMITGDVLKDIKYLKKAVNIKHRQNNPSLNRVMSMHKYIKRLPKLFRITGNVMNDVKDLEKDLDEIQSSDNSTQLQKEGSGIVDRNKINELSDDIDNLFFKFMEVEDYLEKKASAI